jgi:hypothetical protein
MTPTRLILKVILLVVLILLLVVIMLIRFGLVPGLTI